MILYFTGTGNSRYVAEKIAAVTEESILNLFEKIRHRDVSPMRSETPWVFVVPTYAWQIPRVVRDWIRAVDFVGSREAYFVMTCGTDNGNAAKYLQKLCREKGFQYRGCTSVVMPENYIAMFQAPDEKRAKAIIRRARTEIKACAEKINRGEALPEKKIRIFDRLKSSLVNGLFYPFFVKAEKFYAKNNCISCGKCAKSCPLGNIEMGEGIPCWGDACTHCMACICGCPVQAIEYGKKSRGKVRYQCPEKLIVRQSGVEGEESHE